MPSLLRLEKTSRPSSDGLEASVNTFPYGARGKHLAHHCSVKVRPSFRTACRVIVSKSMVSLMN